jgi:peptidyl-prolyl cis-trans isomerase C
MKLWVLALLGCGNAAPETGGRFTVPLTATAPAEDAVVATVDGRPIRASAVADQARAAGTGVKEALSALVDAEVLAGEAARRGLDRDRDAEWAAEAQAVRRLLSTRFESEVTPAQVPANWLRKVYEKNRPKLDHEVELDVWHILVSTGGLEGERKEAARAAAEELAKKARAVHDLDAFKALADTVPGSKYEHVVTERDGWTVPEFSHPAFEQLHKPGDVSSVVETKFGYHVMYLVQIIPARHTSLEEADAELRQGVFPEFQKQEFIRFCERAAGSHEIIMHPERIK